MENIKIEVPFIEKTLTNYINSTLCSLMIRIYVVSDHLQV